MTETTVIPPSADLHDLWKTHQPLGVECQWCQHRGLVPPYRLGARAGSLRCVDTIPFRCTKCKRSAAKVHLFPDRRSVRRFMAAYR